MAMSKVGSGLSRSEPDSIGICTVPYLPLPMAGFIVVIYRLGLLVVDLKSFKIFEKNKHIRVSFKYKI